MNYKKIRNIFTMVFSLALVASLLSINLPRVAAVGNHLDTTFNSSGLRSINFTGSDSASGVAIQTNGKIVIAGRTDVAGTTDNTDFAVARLNANGLLDTTFNTNGTVVTPVLGDGAVSDVAIQPDGKIVVAGSAVMNGIRQFCLVRYNTNGSLDTGFDGNGFVYTLFEPFTSNNVSEIHKLAVQPNGKIVAAGYVSGLNSTGEERQDWAIARYNTNGSLDTTFDGDGRLITDFGANNADLAYSVVIQPDGKILAAGGTMNPNFQFALARYNTDGAADFSFGGTGRVVTTTPVGSVRINSIKLQSDGKIVAGGGGSFPAMTRYNANGSLDTTFGNAGRVSFSGDLSSIIDIALQSDGKIVGTTNRTGIQTFRINPNGSYDAGYGLGGVAVVNEDISAFGFSIAIQADGKIVAAGLINNGGDGDFVVARLLPDMGKPFDFDNDGKTDLGIFRPPVGEWWINRSSNGSTFAAQFGASTDKITPGDFTGDGKTDIALFRPSTGFWFVLRSEDFSFYSFPFGVSTDLPAVGDFDGDSKADSVVFRPSTATWYISKSSGGTTIQQFGANGDVPAIGDYDADGKADIAIFRPSNGQWWIQRSSNNSVIAFQFGSSTDKPVQGDYTGDGKTDVAIWRPSTGEWFILRSENQSFYSFPFGVNGDIASPGDYDGDGRYDATVFRPSTATWYSQRTFAGTLIQQFGANGDKPVPSAFVP